MVTAIILIKTAQGHTPEVAQALIDLPGISEAYSVAGPYDLVAMAIFAIAVVALATRRFARRIA